MTSARTTAKTTKRIKVALRRLSLAALMGLSACGDAGPSEPSGPSQLEFYSWWVNPGETDALAALLKVYNESHPQTNVINAAVADLNVAREQMRTRMVNGSPPDTFQALGGWNLMQWVLYNGRDDTESKMEPVDDLATRQNLRTVLPKALLDQISYNNKMYSVPLGIHRYNLLYFNKKLFADNGLSAPTTMDEFFAVSEALKAKGITPLALGSKIGRPVTQIVLDGILIAQAGVAFRDSYLDGLENPADQRVVDTLNTVVKMLDYTNGDRDELTWNQAAQMVADGTAAMTIVGDWAKGFFLSKGLRPDIELGQVPIPGTQGVFVYLVDSFGVTRGAKNRQATLDFLTVVGASKTQNIFCPIKGSTPPRTDADATLYDALAQKNIVDLKSDTLTTGRDLRIKSAAFTAELDASLRQLVVDRNVEPVVNMLKNRYDLLKSP
jgi:glucose/mannose transport system substrate-binding protein